MKLNWHVYSTQSVVNGGKSLENVAELSKASTKAKGSMTRGHFHATDGMMDFW